MAKTNKEILNAIRQSQTPEYQSIVPLASTEEGLEVYTILEDYPTAKNAFINTLTNKIGKSMFFSKLFNNPYKMLHKGMLPYGTNIEQLFVEMAEKKGFGEHFSNSTSDEADLIKLLPPVVDVCFIQQNFQYKFKTSISHPQLRGAFDKPNGLSDLLSQIVNSLYSSANYAEYLDMKKILLNKTAETSGGSTIGLGLVPLTYANLSNAVISVGTDAKQLAKMVRTYAGKLQFPSANYNLAGVTTWCDPKDLVLFITPEMQAELDVEVLASAFNVSCTDVNVRVLLIDDLGTVGTNTAVKAILADKDCIQAYDTINQTGTFENVDKLGINYFAHKQGIMAGCKYAQAIVFTA